MFTRMFTIVGRREQFDGFARVGREKVIPALRRLDGFEGLLVLANGQGGKILVVTLWESEEALRAGEEASHWFRAFGAEVAGGEVTDVERYEVFYSEAKSRQIVVGDGSSELAATTKRFAESKQCGPRERDGVREPLQGSR